MGVDGRQSLEMDALDERVTLLEARAGKVGKAGENGGGGGAQRYDVRGRNRHGSFDESGAEVIGEEKMGAAVNEGENVEELREDYRAALKAVDEAAATESPASPRSESIRDKWKRLSRGFYSRETPPLREFRQLSAALAPTMTSTINAPTIVAAPPPITHHGASSAAPSSRVAIGMRNESRAEARRPSALVLSRRDRDGHVFTLSPSSAAAGAAPRPPSPSMSARREVALANDEWMSATTKAYRSMLELYQRVRKRSPNLVATDLEGRLQRLDALHQKQLLAVAMLDERCNSLLNSYNTAIRSIACKLLQWDTTLSTWEETIHKMNVETDHS